MNPLPIQRGVNFGFYARNGYYSTEKARIEVDRMRECNVSHVCVISTVLAETFCSPRQYRDFKMTPADDELREIIDYIHEKGMAVQLRPMLECWDGTQRCHINFPGRDHEIMPGKPITYASRWFEGMIDRTLHYARLARRGGCEIFGIDSEIDHIVSYNDEWKRVVAAARSEYKGHVTSCHTHAVNFIKELERKDHWFYDLDSLCSSFYHAASDGTPGTTKAQMMQKLEPVREMYRTIASMYGKPFYFGEIGCCAVAGATKLPYFWSNGGGYDGHEQARYLDVACEMFWNEPWWSGLYWWKWDEQNHRPQFHDDPAGDKGFTVWAKPAAKTMADWFGRKDRR